MGLGFPGGSGGKVSTYTAGDTGDVGWIPVRAPQEMQVGEIPWRRAWQPTPGFLPGEPTVGGAWGLQCIWAQRLGLDQRRLTGQVQRGSDVGCDFPVFEVQELGDQEGDPGFNM